MTKEVQERLLATHRAQRDYALRFLRENFDKLEANNKETEWVNHYLKHKGAVEWLERLKPED